MSAIGWLLLVVLISGCLGFVAGYLVAQRSAIRTRVAVQRETTGAEQRLYEIRDAALRDMLTVAAMAQQRRHGQR